MNQLINGDALLVLRAMKEETIQCCVTSPPYYGLRDYGVNGQIGQETTPDEYVSRLVSVFRELRRVLKRDGTLWLNVGDSYAGAGKGRYADGTTHVTRGKQASSKGTTEGKLTKAPSLDGLKAKDLIGIPWLLAFALRAEGWWLRSDIIWHKPAPMPESVRDRPTRAHEHVFLLTREERYFYNYEEARSPFKTATNERIKSEIKFGGNRGITRLHSKKPWKRPASSVELSKRPLDEQRDGAANWRDVWSITNPGTSDSHFATMPLELAERCILAGSQENDLVLDPFAGFGTTLLAAANLHRRAIGIELRFEYAQMAEKRIYREQKTPLFSNRL